MTGRSRAHMDCFTSPNNCWVGDDMTCPMNPANKGRDQTLIADVLQDCLSSFQGRVQHDGVCCFDRDAAVDYLLSEHSGLTITLSDDASEESP